MNKLQKRTDKQTLAMIDDEHGLLEIMDALLAYIQLTNGDIVAIKKMVKENTGADINPLSTKDKRALRKGGDMIVSIRNTIQQGRKLKGNV